ncbi:MAG TPA: ABC transporter ATP-binding protein [Candidatus Portnoybacteria bacterium]|jgi:putative ABC transport system ATP-binding protein|nr:ABC transporter ATP-binding protein [Candidatus Portnoybacteria bacterium]MDD5752326.1 ABC transporter ATP-binding protein [Candidatus Portnoybacteria bacterium]HNU96672.1 ABC transporter ATP-binding protein [Candidatus Portnoybacteria bacterium]HOZ16646.1 ABC transporter ATP-binding protein [Candidatus Portnoybacteria bacterium]HPH52372.1 ABC transporter ATP-binding protein [Candidatus Portnoybacteria bacterium]
MIEVKNLRKEYCDDEMITTALNDVSFNIEKGEFVAIMGPSGSGKSTLMHIMGFLDRPNSGIFKFEGQSIEDLSDDQLAFVRNNKLGFIFQFFNLLPRTSVFDNVKLPLIYTHITEEEKKERVLKAIESVGLSSRIKNLSNQLSGGEQQRVAIARAIVNNPSVVFADEPTGNLDSKSGQQIMEILQDLNEQGHTIILVTHEQYTAEMAKRIIRLKDGRIIEDSQVVNRKIAREGFLK